MNATRGAAARQIADRRRALATSAMLRLTREAQTERTGDDRTCAKCGASVSVPPEFEWQDGDWCHGCWERWGKSALRQLMKFFGKEAMDGTDVPKRPSRRR